MLLVIDSCGWIEYFRDSKLADKFAKYIERPNSLITPTVIIYEVYKISKLKNNEEQTINALLIMNKTKIVPLTKDIAIAAADFSIEYKLPLADAIIYATAKEFKAKIVTSDPHLEKLPEVIFIK